MAGCAAATALVGGGLGFNCWRRERLCRNSSRLIPVLMSIAKVLVLLACGSCSAFHLAAHPRPPLALPVARATTPRLLTTTVAANAASSDNGAAATIVEKAADAAEAKGLRRLLVGVWRRCDDMLCRVGPPRPLLFIKSLIPKKRPLSKLGNNECSQGIYKVERATESKGRTMILAPMPRAKEVCSIEDAMDLM